MNRKPEAEEARQRQSLAVDHYPGKGPRLVFCSGFKSNKTGTKAEFLKQLCAEQGWAYTRFDYQGHGDSPGEFIEGTISCWLEDTLAVIDATQEPLLLVGSSMGGWLALLAARLRPERVSALMLLACATDFTHTLETRYLSDKQRETLNKEGVVYLPSDYDEGDPYAITRDLLEDGRQHRLLSGSIGINCPVRMIHGTADPDVPWQTSAETLERLTSDDARLILVRAAEHRLSDAAALELIEQELTRLHRQTMI